MNEEYKYPKCHDVNGRCCFANMNGLCFILESTYPKSKPCPFYKQRETDIVNITNPNK